MINFSKKLFPINRSLTGDGNLKTLFLIKKRVKALKIKSFNSNSRAYDWKIPYEWNVVDAWIQEVSTKKKILDFKKNNLVIFGYSTSVNKIINYNELKKIIYTLQKQPSAIPYVTSYYKKRYGFCMSYQQFKKLNNNEKYHIFIDSNFKKGKMHYGELVLPGKSKKEVFFSTYICHPSMANNEVSGIVLATYLANYIKKKVRNFTYRIVFLPETIGSIAYINRNIYNMRLNIFAGFNLTCVGDNRSVSYLPSKFLDTYPDRLVKRILKKENIKFIQYSWLDRGSDERQYSSPHIDLPFVSLMRTKYGEYPEYHTSLDKLGTVVKQEGLKKSYYLHKLIIQNIERSIFPISSVKCEPFLTKYNLIKTLSTKTINYYTQDLLNFLSYSDGKHSIDDISEKCRMSSRKAKKIFQILLRKKLIKY